MKRFSGYMLCYLVAIALYIIAAFMFFSAEYRHAAIPFLCFGSTFLFLGVIIANKPSDMGAPKPASTAKTNGVKKNKKKKRK